MGTDIHLYVEKRNGVGWVSCDKWEDDEYSPGQKTVPYREHFYGTRNYDLFAILANVRNGRGFAGTDTGDGFKPICEPRGLPDDLSPEMKVEAESCDHTPSWVTLRELLDYDWTRVTTKRGLVNGPQFEKWDRWERGQGHGPHSYCGGAWGGDVEHISLEEMEIRVKNIKHTFQGMPPKDMETAIGDRLGSTYCPVSWQEPYYRAASEFLSETMPRLWRLGKPEDVRLVFWFDS